MKTLSLSLFALSLVLISSCSSTRLSTASEYDSVYFGSKDQIGYASVETEENNEARYSDTDREDDFQYSRRLRRFGSTASNSNWRYYDPFYANDAYYVMGTPSWNTWNNNGWYDCNSPWIGTPYGYGFNTFNSPYWGGFNSWNNPYMYGYGNMGYYNPWINNYYGYGCGFSPYGYGGWGNPWYGGGYYGGYYGGGYYGGYYGGGWVPGGNVVIGANQPIGTPRGSTSTLVGSNASVNGGTVTPNSGISVRPTINTQLNNPNTAGTPYFTPRSNSEFTQPSNTTISTDVKGNSNVTPRPKFNSSSEVKGNSVNSTPSSTPRSTWNNTPKSTTTPNSTPSSTPRSNWNNTPKSTSTPNSTPSSTWNNTPKSTSTPSSTPAPTPKVSVPRTETKSSWNSSPSPSSPSRSSGGSSSSSGGGGRSSGGGGGGRPK
ncbi:MAG: hypothetical protein ACKVTZ_10040 [Bacteroidia bacterium]